MKRWISDRKRVSRTIDAELRMKKSFGEVVAFRKAVLEFRQSKLFRPSRHGCGEPAGYPWA